MIDESIPALGGLVVVAEMQRESAMRIGNTIRRGGFLDGGKTDRFPERTRRTRVEPLVSENPWNV